MGEGRTWKHHTDDLKLRDLPAPENLAPEEPSVIMETPEVVHPEVVH